MTVEKFRLANLFCLSVIIHLLVLMFWNIEIPEKVNEEPIVVELTPPPEPASSMPRFSDETNKVKGETKTPAKPASPSGVVNKDLAYVTPKTKSDRPSPEQNIEETPGTYKKSQAVRQFLPSHELIKELARNFQPGTDADVKTSKIVNLDTTELKYISYMTKIKRQIDLVWTYPTLAIERGEQGTLILQFTIVSSGDLKDVRVIRSSGSKILDDAAVEAIRTASPYPVFPKEWKEEELTIAARMEYVLGYTIVQ
jgi:protein TonB